VRNTAVFKGEDIMPIPGTVAGKGHVSNLAQQGCFEGIVKGNGSVNVEYLPDDETLGFYVEQNGFGADDGGIQKPCQLNLGLSF